MGDVKAAVRALYPRMPRKVEIIDTTLRDGEQSPGVWFTPEEKLELAALLAGAGVAVLDAGFPASSPREIELLQEMRRRQLPIRIGATARTTKGDVLAVAESRADDIFLFFPMSDLRIRQTLGVDRDRAREMLRTAAVEAAGRGLAVTIVFEDASRSDPALLMRAISDVIKQVSVRRVIPADSVGCAVPGTMARLVETLLQHLPPETAVSAHTHNDFGLATANTLSAVMAGASSVTCTVNGIGERAGNADLAELVASFEHLLGVEHGVNPLHLGKLSAEVARMSGLHMSPTKPVTGANVFRHESGVHVDAILKEQRSYEHLPASWVGRRHEFILGKNSGKSLVRQIIVERGGACDDVAAAEILHQAKLELEQRSKAEHDRAYNAKLAFEHGALSGVDPSRVMSWLAHRTGSR
jgi:isopropylmalate/homocitrate/citramalate synthase